MAEMVSSGGNTGGRKQEKLAAAIAAAASAVARGAQVGAALPSGGAAPPEPAVLPEWTGLNQRLALPKTGLAPDLTGRYNGVGGRQLGGPPLMQNKRNSGPQANEWPRQSDPFAELQPEQSAKSRGSGTIESMISEYTQRSDVLNEKMNQAERQSKILLGSIQSGGDPNDLNATMDEYKQAKIEWNQVQDALYHLNRQGEALEMEEEAEKDPDFSKYVHEGEVRLEDNYKIILRNGGDTSWYQDYSAMDDTQKKIYAYYYGKDGTEKNALEYKNKVQWEIDSALSQDYLSGILQMAKDDPVSAGIASVFTTPYAAAKTVGDMLVGMTEPDSQYTHSANPNTPGQRMTKGIQLARQVGLDQIQNPLLKKAAEVGYSIADSAPSLVLSSMGIPVLGPAYAGLLKGTGTYTDAVSRGVTQKEAFTLGAVAATADLITDKVNVGTLLDKTSLGKNKLGKFMQTLFVGGANGVQEELINFTADVLVSQERSEWNTAIRNYMDDGYSEKEAFQKAFEDQALKFGMDYFSGAVSAVAKYGKDKLMSMRGSSSDNIAGNFAGAPLDSVLDALSLDGLFSDQGSGSAEWEDLELVPQPKREAADRIQQETGRKVIFDRSLPASIPGILDLDGTIRLNPNVGGPENLRQNATRLLSGKAVPPLQSLDDLDEVEYTIRH